MIRALKAVSAERGRDPREFVLAAFGGAGPVHAADMARLLGIPRVIVPVPACGAPQACSWPTCSGTSPPPTEVSSPR